MAKEYKVVMHPMFKKKLASLSKKEQKEVLKMVDEVKKNPHQGKPIDPVDIEALPHEKCECEKPWFIYMDKNSHEVFFNCETYKCNGFWMSEKEFKKGREEHKPVKRTG